MTSPRKVLPFFRTRIAPEEEGDRRRGKRRRPHPAEDLRTRERTAERKDLFHMADRKGSRPSTPFHEFCVHPSRKVKADHAGRGGARMRVRPGRKG